MLAFIESIIRRLSFNQTDYLLCQKINQPVAIKQKQDQLSLSHPQGFVQEFYDTTSSLLEIYASVVYGLQSQDVKERIAALQLLSQQYNYNTDSSIPMNLVRLRLMLMMKAIANKDSFYEQLRNLRDFQKTLSSSHERIVQMLKRYNLAQVAETPQLPPEYRIFDPHILDSTNTDQRTFSSLLTHLFITGIVDTTLVCTTLPSKEGCIEACEAAHFLKIKLRLAVSFDTYQDGYACRYLAILPYLHSGDRCARFYSKHQFALEKFEKSMSERHASRLAAITRNLENFNEHHLGNLNQNFSPDQKLYYLHELTLQEICEHYGKNTLTHIHLGDFLYSKYEKVLFNRLVLLANMQKGLHWKQNQNNVEWDQGLLKKRYELLKHEYDHLSPASLIQRYFADLLPERMIPSSHDLDDIAKTFHALGGYIRFIPSDNLDENAYRFLFKKNGPVIDQVEIYNLCDSSNKPLEKIVSFAQFVENHNTQLLQEDKNAKTLEPVCASYSLCGPNPPFMGFLFQKESAKPSPLQALPALISSMIYNQGKPVDAQAALLPAPKLYHLERKKPSRISQLGRLSPLQRFLQSVRYIHPHIYQIILILIGLCATTMVVPLAFALVFLLLGACYMVILRAIGAKRSMVEDETVYEEKLSFMLFFLGLSLPIQQVIFQAFSADWFFFVPPVLLVLLQVFCLALVTLAGILLYAKVAHARQEAIKNPIMCLIAAWPLASLSVVFLPALKMPPSIQLYSWTFLLGILSTVRGFRAINRRKKEKILEDILQKFDEKSCTHCTLALLDLLYIVPRQPWIRRYWKKIMRTTTKKSKKENTENAKENTEDAPEEKLKTLGLRVKEWSLEEIRYSQILDLILSSYTPSQVDLLLSCALKNWPTFIKFIKKY